MRATDAFRLAGMHLSAHKLRSGLTMLGMMFGVGAVISMLSIGAGAERSALALIDRMGLRNVVVKSRDLKPTELAEVRKKSLGVSLRDAEAIGEAVPGVSLAAPRVEVEAYKILAPPGKTEGKVHGVSHRHAELTNLVVDEGRFFDALEERTHAQVCVLGGTLRRELFGADRAVGRAVKVNDLWLEVVGVLRPEPAGKSGMQGLTVGSTAREIYLPVSTAIRKLDRDPLKSPLDEIVVRLGDGASARETAAAVSGLLARLHGGASDYEIVVPEALLEQSRQTQRLFNLVMGCIAGISLLVGGIGIMNIMLASVLEQTREIGVRRAVGARRWDIRFQFLVTAFSLSLLGGLCGVALGVGIARVVAAYAGWPTVVTLGSVALSSGVSTVVGLVSGLYPAARAAALDPIEALRYE